MSRRMSMPTGSILSKNFVESSENVEKNSADKNISEKKQFSSRRTSLMPIFERKFGQGFSGTLAHRTAGVDVYIIVLSCALLFQRTRVRYFSNSVPEISTNQRDYKPVPFCVHHCQMSVFGKLAVYINCYVPHNIYLA